jgi:hypothetical protein
MAEALLRRIARYPVSLSADPRENRLTEICAAILGNPQCAGLARHLALGWLEAAADHSGVSDVRKFDEVRVALADDTEVRTCDVRTQLSLGSLDERRRPDLLLTFHQRALPGQRVLVWVESKHGTAPHDRQLFAYVENQRLLAGSSPAVVLLVAPRASYPSFDRFELPADVPQLKWEQTAEIIQEFHTENPVGKFLVEELLAYLKEERLVDPDPLRSFHLKVLTAYQDARRSLFRVCEIAAEYMTELWGPGTVNTRLQSGPYWSYKWSAADGTTIRRKALGLYEPELQWQLAYDAASVVVDGEPGAPLVTARPIGNKARLPAIDEKTNKQLTDAGLEVLTVPMRSKGWHYVGRTAYVGELVLGDPDLASQGRTLADWIDQSFRSVAAATV